jgi:hypothetical protein
MAVLREYDIVRVAKLIDPARKFDGTDGVRRSPRIGDVATICHENSRTGIGSILQLVLTMRG